jgi:hypothetical protein
MLQHNEVMAKFVYECILTKFRPPLILVLDQGVHFINNNFSINEPFFFYHIISTTYYPQDNGQA